MKILHVITRFGLGGAEENTFRSCQHQAASGHEVFMVYGPASKPDHYRAINDQITYIEVPSLVREVRPGKDLKALGELTALFRRIRPDVVHTHTSKAGILGRIAAFITGVPHIVHGVHIVPFRNVSFSERLVYLGLEHLTARFTDLFVHVSQGTRTAYDREHIGDSQPHAVVHSGMEVGHFQNAAWPEDWRELLGVAPDADKPKVLLMMAALDKRKRHVEFLEGFAEVTRKGDPVRLLLAGEGREQPAIEAQIDRLDLGDRVKVLGYYPQPERLVALSDIGVLASMREGLPRVVIQYLAGSKPVVVSPLDAIEEVLKDNVNGRVVCSDRAQDVAAVALEVAGNAGELDRLRAGAEMTDVSGWSLGSMYSALDKGYSQMMKAGRKPRFSLWAHDPDAGERLA